MNGPHGAFFEINLDHHQLSAAGEDFPSDALARFFALDALIFCDHGLVLAG